MNLFLGKQKAYVTIQGQEYTLVPLDRGSLNVRLLAKQKLINDYQYNFLTKIVQSLHLEVCYLMEAN